MEAIAENISLEWDEAVRSGQCANSSFYWPIRMLEKETREAMWVLYAFCHELDDIADGHMDADKKAELLFRCQSTLTHGHGERSPVVVSMLELMERYRLPIKLPLTLIEALIADVREEQFPPTEDQLTDYCHGVASVVGLMTVRVLGVSTDAADDYACYLGQAFQLTNIIRDMVEDAEIGRCYLPKEWLEAYGLSSEPEAIITNPEAYQPILRKLGGKAERNYRDAFHAFPEAYRPELRSTRMMWAVYQALFEQMKRNDFHWQKTRYRVPGWQKAWCILTSF